MVLENISPIEKAGYQKLKPDHWVIHTEILIEATPAQVWSVLTDSESYSRWNEMILRMDGKIEDQGTVVVLFNAGPNIRKRVYRNRLFVQEGVEFYWNQVQWKAYFIKDRHTFRVEAAEGCKARFIHSDYVKGGFSWLIGKQVVNVQRTLYPAFNCALKAELGFQSHSESGG